MTIGDDAPRVVSAQRTVAAPAERLFELVADPARQVAWDGNDNLSHADDGQRVHGVGEVFRMTITNATVRENHVAEFEEGRLISWRPADPGQPPAGHLWRWEFEPAGDGHTLVRHTYDWSGLSDPRRFERARSTTTDRLNASLERLAELAERL